MMHVQPHKCKLVAPKKILTVNFSVFFSKSFKNVHNLEGTILLVFKEKRQDF